MSKNEIKIGVAGIGMVGGQTMRWFLEKGWERGKNLFCSDKDKKKKMFDDLGVADIVFLCVPTPSKKNGNADISMVEDVVKKLPDGERAIVIKSTVPPGTTAYLANKYPAKGDFLFSPEFLTEKQAWLDFIRPDRQIVASANEKAKKWAGVILNLLPAGSLNSPGVGGTYNFYEVNSTEAEIVKYASNVFGAMKVSFFNIIFDICGFLGADYDSARELISHDRRIGDSWTNAGEGNYRGFGGACFPKDLNALIKTFHKISGSARNKKEKIVLLKGLGVLQSIREYNDALLKVQGLTVRDITKHHAELEKIIKKNRSV